MTTTEFDPRVLGQGPIAGAPRAAPATRTTSLHRRIVDAIVALVTQAVATHARRRRQRETARILSRLSDDMLKDLGLTRPDIRAYDGKDDIRNWRTINRWR